jgi:hypothetical protein
MADEQKKKILNCVVATIMRHKVFTVFVGDM